MTEQWDFVFAAYAVTLLGTALLLLASWRAMRNAETQAGAIGRGDPQ